MQDEIATAAEAVEADAMPRRIEVHTDAQAAPKGALPQSVNAKPLKQKSPAEWAYERLILYIQNFESQLDNEHEVAVGFVGGDAGVLRIEGMGFSTPISSHFTGAMPAAPALSWCSMPAS